jgi:uncharacterized protein
MSLLTIPMQIIVPKIPKDGLKLTLSMDESWVDELIMESLPEENPDKASFKGQVTIRKTSDNVQVEGQISIQIKPPCARCLEEVPYQLDVPFCINLAPRYHVESEDENDEISHDEIELTQDDLEFNFYDGHQFHLKDILRDPLVLALPLRFLCQQECRGLCTQCGCNLNEKACTCPKNVGGDERWEVLKAVTAKM